MRWVPVVRGSDTSFSSGSSTPVHPYPCVVLRRPSPCCVVITDFRAIYCGRVFTAITTYLIVDSPSFIDSLDKLYKFNQVPDCGRCQVCI